MRVLFCVMCTILGMVFGNDAINWNFEKEYVHGTNFDVEVQAVADGKGEYTEYGILIWDEEGNIVYKDFEGIFSPSEDISVWYNLCGLQPDADYTYQIYVIYNGEYYYSPFESFRTSTGDL